METKLSLRRRLAGMLRDLTGRRTPLDQALDDVPLRTWLWSDLATRRRIQARGMNPVPVSFYSNTPSIADIEGSFEYADVETPPYPLDLDEAELRAELGSLMPFAAEFSPPKADPGRGAYFWDNGLFTGADAMAYYCYLRRLKPRTVIEIGSGFSSLVARAALAANGSGRLICVEPFPRDFLKGQADIELIAKPVQALDADFFNGRLTDGDVLFIDSTHTVKSGSDCLHIYLRLLPRLKHRLHVHVHDVVLPFALPKEWLLHKQIHWTEQYLLLAFLLDNPKARILFGSHYNHRYNREAMDGLMGDKAESDGASFWFEYRGA
ncbi:MAG TPA: class I SAM-dependent methyltransferase [Gammaproteobacteria bacterium]|jgi:hypothetical protein